MAHVVNKFKEADSTDPERVLAAKARALNSTTLEDEANAIIVKDKLTGACGRCYLLARGKEQSVPLLASLRQWLLEQKEQVLPKSPIACRHQLHAEPVGSPATGYTTDGDLHIDNNMSERTLKLIGMGRINCLFLGSDKGGQTAAVLFSFTATCKHLRINMFVYLRDISALVNSLCSSSGRVAASPLAIGQASHRSSTPNALAPVMRMYPYAFRRKTAPRVYYASREIHRRCTTSPGNPPPHCREVNSPDGKSRQSRSESG